MSLIRLSLIRSARRIRLQRAVSRLPIVLVAIFSCNRLRLPVPVTQEMKSTMSRFFILGILCLVSFATASVNATEYFVATQAVNASDNNPGTHRAPFKTITKACETAQAGDVVTIRKGTYREALMPQNSGEEGRPITFRTHSEDEVWIKGSIAVEGFRKDGDLWVKKPWRRRYWFDDKVLGGVADERKTLWKSSSRQENIFVNGQRLQWAPSRKDLAPGRFVWTEEELVIDPPEGLADPHSALVEAPVLEQVLSCWQSDPRSYADYLRLLEKNPNQPKRDDVVQRHHIHLKGLRFSQTRQVLNRFGARANGNHWVIEDCVFEKANANGINMSGDRGVLRNCTVRNNGQGGLGASGSHVLIEDVVSYRNNSKFYKIDALGGGNKLTVTRNVTIRNLISAFNYGSGVWYDIDCYGGVNENCVVFGNRPVNGAYFWEISFDSVFRNNVGFACHAKDSSFYGAGIVSSCSNGTRFQDNVFLSTTGGLSCGGARGEGEMRTKEMLAREIRLSKERKGRWIGRDNVFERNLVVEPTSFAISVREGGGFDSSKPEASNQFLNNSFLVDGGSARVGLGHDWLADPIALNASHPKTAVGNKLYRRFSDAPPSVHERMNWAMKRVLNAVGRIDDRFREDYQSVTVKGIWPIGSKGTRVTGYFLEADGTHLMVLDIPEGEGSIDLISEGATKAELWDFPVLAGAAQRDLEVHSGRIKGNATGPFALLLGLSEETVAHSSAVAIHLEVAGKRTTRVRVGRSMEVQLKLRNPLKDTVNFRVFGPGLKGARNVQVMPGVDQTVSVNLVATEGMESLQYVVFSDRIPKLVKRLQLNVLDMPLVPQIGNANIKSYRSYRDAMGKPLLIGAGNVIRDIYDEKTGAKWLSDKDLSAKVGVSWNDHALFVVLTVRDNVIHTNNPPDIGDCIELFLDGRAEGFGKRDYDRGVYRILLQPCASDQWQDASVAENLKGLRARSKREAGGYVMAIRIAWSIFPDFRPKSGATLGFDVALNDSDGEPRRKALLIWSGNSGIQKDASGFGRLRLE